MKKLGIWLLIGLAIRLILIPISLHPDFRAVNLAAYLISQKHQLLTFYDYLSRLPRDNSLVLLYSDNLFIYPPLAYVSHALFNFLFFKLYPVNAFWTLINDYGALRLTPGFPLLMYWLKLPYLFVDILCLYFLVKKFKGQDSLWVLWLWWLNPIVIYTSYMMGQFDIFIALFILLAAIKSDKNPILSSIFLGVGAGFKPFTLLLLPLIPGNKIKNIAVGLLSYLIIIFPYLHSAAFKQYALFASQSDKMFFAKIAISGSQYIPIFLVGLILIYWWNFYKPNSLSTWGWMLTPLLLFYSITHYHPQWFLWMVPLLVLVTIKQKSLLAPVISIIICHILIVLFFESSLNFGLFGVYFSLFNYLNPYFPSDQLVSIIRGLMLGSSVYLTIILANDQK